MIEQLNILIQKRVFELIYNISSHFQTGMIGKIIMEQMDHLFFLRLSQLHLIFFLLFMLLLFRYILWRKKVNKKYNNDTATGIVIIFTTLLCCILWVIYFYFKLFQL